jgi:hypothetical protein
MEVTLMWFIPLTVSFEMKRTRGGWSMALRVQLFI